MKKKLFYLGLLAGTLAFSSVDSRAAMPTVPFTGVTAGIRDGVNWIAGLKDPLNAGHLFVAVPEPSCLAFAVGGLVLILGRRRIR